MGAFMMVADIDRSGKRTLGGPATVHALPKRAGFDIQQSRPIGEKACFPAEGNVAIRSLVSRLVSLWYPDTVGRTVASIVVLALNAVTRTRRSPHIREEVLEREPAFANADATTFVILVNLGAGYAHQPAADPHVAPGPKGFAFALAMTAIDLCSRLLPQAPATSRTAAFEARVIHDDARAAGAFAKPMSSVSFLDNEPPSETPAPEIIPVRGRINTRHARLQSRPVCLGSAGSSQAIR